MECNNNSIKISIIFPLSQKPFIVINNDTTTNIEQNIDNPSNDYIKEICQYCGKEFPRLKEHINKSHIKVNKKLKVDYEPKNILIENIMSFNMVINLFLLIIP